MTEHADLLTVVHDVRVERRATDAEVVGPAGRCRVRADRLFEILAAFERPASIAGVLRTIAVHGRVEWAELASTLFALRGAGVLVSSLDSEPRATDFGTLAMHALMLHDELRTRTFLDAVRAVVKPGDIVIDLGTGTGVLAVAAARAGARRVYAIEETAIADIAERVFALNGVADRVTLMRGSSLTVELEDRATVLISETLGTDPLDEGFLVSLDDARRRLLTPDAAIVPGRLSFLAQLVDVAALRLPHLARTDADRWLATHGIDLGPLVVGASTETVSFSGPAWQAPTSARDSEAVVVDAVDLARDVPSRAERRFGLRCTRGAARVGIALGYTAQLAPGIDLPIGLHGDADTHWPWRVFSPLEPRSAVAGETVTADYVRDRTKTKVTFRSGRAGDDSQ